ncbi:hypothetical protein RIF29_30067 [Crotalaria pallida]|uniref:Uncharacterized protein n=1 Tax=Crotalaria pallida TaxID=3830 RepID=A0AAN9HUF6_CROPI
MEALSGLHRHHQSPTSSFHYSCPPLTPSPSSSLFLSPPSSSQTSPSIRASSSLSDPPMPNHHNPEPKSPQLLKASTFDQIPQYPEPNSLQILNPLPKVPTFDQNLQSPESNSLHFFDKVPSFATLTAASVFLFLGFCQNGFTYKPMANLPSIVSIQALDDANINLEEFQGGVFDYVETILHMKLKERVSIVHSFKKTKTDYDEAWEVLKAKVSSSSVNFELVKVGFEEILERKKLGCEEGYYVCVLECLERVDEGKISLKGIKFAMDRCERENRDLKHFLRLFNIVVARIRVLEEDMVCALKYFQELEKEE